MIPPRPWITVPDGRRFRGMWPQNVRSGSETPFIVALAKDVRGVCEVTLPVGRADVATDTYVYEVEPVGSWRAGARQAFGYAGMTGLQPAVALFGAAEYEPIFLRIRDRMPGLVLWVWDGRWEQVTNRRDAKRVRRMNTAPEHPRAAGADQPPRPGG